MSAKASLELVLASSAKSLPSASCLARSSASGELGFGGGGRVLRIGGGDEDFLEGDDVLGDVAHGEFDLVVFLLDFIGEGRRGVGELLGAHGLDDHFFAGHFAVAFHGEAAAFEFLAELDLVAVIELAHLALDFLIDDVGLDGGAELFELIEDDLPVHEFLDDFGFGFLELVSNWGPRRGNWAASWA